jgi:lysozyme
MKLSDRGLLALVRHEGVVPAPYKDVAGVWTWGIGHTASAGNPDPYKMPRGIPTNLEAAISDAFALFRKDVAQYEGDVLRAVDVKVAQHEFDALVSFHYNTGGIFKAALTKELNDGDRETAADAFMGWTKPAAIIPRRKDEQRLFREGVYPTGTVPVWGVTADGKVDWRKPIRTLTDMEALALLRPDHFAPPESVQPAPAPSATEPPQPDAGGLMAALVAFLRALASLLKRN